MQNRSLASSAPILIIDDCRDACGQLSEMLLQLGYENVSTATDGTPLFGGNRADDYKLILLDMHMPGRGGLDIMRQLRSKTVGNFVPVIAISGDQRYTTVAIAAGACAFLLKPFNSRNLETTMYDALFRFYGQPN